MDRMKVKICMIGEGAVGKTSLIRRYVLDQFDDRYVSTLGAKVTKKEVVVPDPRGNGKVVVDLTIWDVMGEKGFRELLKEAYFHGAQGALAVCDITRYETLPELRGWIESVENVTGRIPVLFLVNKVDLKDQVAMREKDIVALCEEYSSSHFYTSAKTGENVDQAFYALAKAVVEDQLGS